MKRLLCLWAHRPHVPTGAHAYDPISCTRCGRVFDADTGGWHR